MDPELQKDLDELKKSLHTSNLSTRNRILSVIKDSKYVSSTKDKYYPQIPVIPNDRCGRWYVDPKYYDGEYLPAYFKSTDGHTNNWSFSTRRLNLHLLSQIRRTGGVIIVDSTRRGKKIPDSFSKTVPIWMAVMNKFIFPDASFDDLFSTPAETVSEYEHNRILRLLPKFYGEFQKFSDIVRDKILIEDDASCKRKKLKPFWIYPGCGEYPIFDGSEDFYPIILLSASEQSQDGENKMFGYTYVQGAGDDHELWSRGLNPQIFWSNYEMACSFVRMSDLQVDDVVDQLVTKEDQMYMITGANSEGKFWKSEDIVKVRNNLYFGKIEKNLAFDEAKVAGDFEFDKIIVLDSSFVYQADPDGKQRVFNFKLDSGSKKSAKLLRGALPGMLQILINKNEKILIVCNTGEDLSVAVAICYVNHLNGKDKRSITKETIRRDLIGLMELKKINPQRATLNAVNAYLMS